MSEFLKTVFGSAIGASIGVEIAHDNMARNAVRTLARNRELMVQELIGLPVDCAHAMKLKHHISQIEGELTRYAYYGYTPPSPRRPFTPDQQRMLGLLIMVGVAAALVLLSLGLLGFLVLVPMLGGLLYARNWSKMTRDRKDGDNREQRIQRLVKEEKAKQRRR